MLKVTGTNCPSTLSYAASGSQMTDMSFLAPVPLRRDLTALTGHQSLANREAEPGSFRRFVVKKGSKIFCITSAFMPTPVSAF